MAKPKPKKKRKGWPRCGMIFRHKRMGKRTTWARCDRPLGHWINPASKHGKA